MLGSLWPSRAFYGQPDFCVIAKQPDRRRTWVNRKHFTRARGVVPYFGLERVTDSILESLQQLRLVAEMAFR
jgi:hypothetical protein